MEQPTTSQQRNLSRISNENDEISSSWITPIHADMHHLRPDNVWIKYLSNIIKIGRLVYGLDSGACEYFNKRVLPHFCTNFYGSELYQIIIEAMSGKIKYRTALNRIQIPRNFSEDTQKAHNLYENVFLNMSEDAQIPAVEFHRIFDMKSVELVNMAVNASNGELQEGATLSLAKWTLPIPHHQGLLSVYGTNIIFPKSDINLYSRLLTINSAEIVKRLEQKFRIIDNFHHKDLRLGCLFQSFDIYVTLSLLPPTCTFDCDVFRKFINIPSEPYPYDVINDYERICISIFVPDETISKKSHLEITTYIINNILNTFQIITEDFHILSNFTQFPLIPYQTTIRYPLQFNMYFFHKYLIDFMRVSYWSAIVGGPLQVPRIMPLIKTECLLIIHRPILSSIPILPLNEKSTPKTVNLFLGFWSVDDIIEIHCKLITACSRKQVVDLFREKKKRICFKMYNGFLIKCENELVPDVLDNVFDRYSTLLYLWITTILMFEKYHFIKTWTDEEHQHVKSIPTNSNFSSSEMARIKQVITSVQKFYFITKIFTGKTNMVNVAEISYPELSFTLIFDYPVNFYNLETKHCIEMDQENITNNFKSIDNLELASKLLTINAADLLSMPNDKYILQCRELPAVVLIGQKWDEVDAVNITQHFNNLSHNIVRSIQTLLCKNTIMKCIVTTNR